MTKQMTTVVIGSLRVNALFNTVAEDTVLQSTNIITDVTNINLAETISNIFFNDSHFILITLLFFLFFLA